MKTPPYRVRPARDGFTLVEVLVAVAVGAALVAGISAVTQSTVATAERQKLESRKAQERSTALDLLRQDWRGRVRITAPTPAPPEGTKGFVLLTTSDGLSAEGPRTGVVVTYLASEEGLSRHEAGTTLLLVKGRVGLEFWDGAAWKQELPRTPSALRVTLTGPDESVVLR